jgi:hypothetical protein
MQYLDVDRLNAIDPREFREREPFPWINPAGLIQEPGYHRLVESLPDVSQFTATFGEARKFDQRPHDRFVLECNRRTRLPTPWTVFLHELRQVPYRTFLQRLFGVDHVVMRFHWLYTPSGCSVSPHCDGSNELGTHLFYFNTPDDWDPAWGGSTLILDDGRRISPTSAPWFDSFVSETPSQSVGNYSLLFERTDHSWHGVRELRCPSGHMRKIFGVVVSRNHPGDRLIRLWRRPRYTYF